jgi:hypothetical protein
LLLRCSLSRCDRTCRGSSTRHASAMDLGTGRAPTIRRSYLCSRFRQSVSISPSLSFMRPRTRACPFWVTSGHPRACTNLSTRTDQLCCTSSARVTARAPPPNDGARIVAVCSARNERQSRSDRRRKCGKQPSRLRFVACCCKRVTQWAVMLTNSHSDGPGSRLRRTATDVRYGSQADIAR